MASDSVCIALKLTNPGGQGAVVPFHERGGGVLKHFKRPPDGAVRVNPAKGCRVLKEALAQMVVYMSLDPHVIFVTNQLVVASGIDLSLEDQQSRKHGLTEVLPHTWPFGLDEISGCQLPALDKGAFPRKLAGIKAFTRTCCLHHRFHLSMLELVVSPDGCSLGDMLADGFHLLFVHCKSAQDISAVTLFAVS